MELRLTTIVVALAFIGAVTCVPARHQATTQRNNQVNTGSNSQEILQLLRQIDAQVKDDVSSETPRQFAELVGRLSHLSHDVISSIDREVRSSSSQWSSKKIEDLWNDALIMDASEGSLRQITKQIIDSSVSPARKSYLLMMMPFIERPSAGAVRAVLPLLEDKQVERQTLLSVSALIANARKANSAPEKELREAAAAIIDYIKRHETSADKVTVALKALHNLHAVADEIALVTKYATDASNAKSVRIAALEALADSASDDFVRQKVEKLYHDSQESVEIRIAAYKVLVAHANPQVVKRIISSLNGEVNKQVGAFVTSHLANLKETSAPRHEEIRRLLSDAVIPVDRFPSDLRKYSRNVELSQHKFGIGAVVDADLIYEQSAAPRSVRFNLSLPLYHREINLVEVSLRQEGLEDEMDKLFSSNGPLAGKNMKEIVSQVTEFLQSSDNSNRVMALRKSIARSSSANVDASMSLKLNGNTVVYIDASDLTKSQENVRAIVNQMKQQLSGDWSQDRAFAFKFDRKFQIPSETGLQEISVNGTAVFAFKVDRHGLWPSMAMELSTRSPSKHIIQRVHSSPSLKFVIEGGKITLRFAENKMNILTVSNEAYEIDAQGHETAIVVPTRSYQHCFNGMNNALGINVCASVSGPKNLWSEKAPCYAPWTMQLTLVKHDNKMSGWQLTADRSANGRSVRLAFDTPRSSIKRNVAFEFELLDQLTGLRGKIELPRKSMQVTAGYQAQSDKLNGKFEVAVNEKEKYSVEAGLKSKSSGKRVEYMPSLRIEIPKAQPIDLVGTVSLESGRKNSMSFDLRSNAQADRKFIKGTITREGNFLKNFKLSSDLQAQIDSVTLRLFSMTDKKEDGSAQTDVKVEYQLPNSRQHNAEFIGKIQNLDQSGESLKMNSFVELKMTQFPEKNVHASWNIQHKPREHLENELTIMWKDQMNDPKRKIHLLHTVKLTGVKSGITATCDNFASIDIAPLNMKYEMKASGHYQRSGAPNHKLSFEVNDKINKNTVAASWEYRHKSLSPLKMSIDASLRVNERAFRYSDQIEEISPRTYKGATELQWADSKKANVNYIFKRQSQGNNEVYELTGETKLPSMSLEHSHMMRISPRDMQFNSKMNKQQEKLWDITGQLTKDDQSSVLFDITGVQGKFNISPFSVKKTGHFSLNGRSISHTSDIALSPETFTLSSKTTQDKKTLFALNSKMSENVLAGPHDWEIRYAGPTVKAGERKIKIHHEINNGKAQGTVTYYVKNAEQAKFDVYASGKSVDSKVQLNAGITLKTAQKYHKYDGFNFALQHQHESYANKGMRSASTLNAEFSEEQKVRLTLETAKEGSMRQGKASAKVIIDTPVFDFKHQQAQFDADWSADRARVSMNAQTNENKTLRCEGEFEQKNGRIFARIAGQSEVHAQKHEATFIADKESITVSAKSNDKEILTTKGKVNYKNARDFTASLAGQFMSSPAYHGSVEARPAGKQVTYTVAAKKDNKSYATGSMTVDTSAGCAVALRMKLARRNISISLDSQAARDLTNGPHKMTVSVEGDRLPKRSLDMTHQIKENKLRQNVIYTIGERESFNLKSNVFYVAKNEGRATRHNCDMDIVLTVEGKAYNVKHEGFVTLARKEFQFSSKAQLQDKNVWQFEGQFGKSGKQSLKFDVAGHSGSMECSPYQENTVARFAIQSARYNHATDMELNRRAKTLKLSSKAALYNKSLYSLNIVRVPDQENQVAFESKWFDCKMKCDPTRSPLTASFVYSGKTKDKTEMKSSMSLDKDEFKVNAEGKCAYSKKYTASMTSRRSNSHADIQMNVEENNRDLLSGHARYETTNGFRGQFSIKKDGKEFISTRAQLARSARNGPNEIELTLDTVEQMKLRHEKSNERDTITFEHTKSGARRNFAQASAQMQMKGDLVDVQLEFNSDFAKRIGSIKSTSVVLSHRHEMSKRRFNSKSSGKAVINNSPFEVAVEAAVDPKSKMTLEMSAQSPIHKFEKQSLSFESAWNKESASIASKLVSSAGCGMKLNAKIATDAQRHQSVSGSISIETPKKKFERQEAQFNANWDESSAQFKLTASDAKSRKLQLAGESEITANKIFARGQTDSDFAFIKSSFVEVRADRESGDADVTVKYNGKDILQGKAKGKWSNWNQFDATVQGKARSSAMYTVTMQASDIAAKQRYNLLAKRDNQNVASVEVTRDSSEGNKYTVDASLPLMKTKASMNSVFSRKATLGPHHVQVDFESEKMGAHSATFTHKIQDDRVKCAFTYERNGKSQLDVHHTGSYKYNRAEKKVSMDTEIECKIQKRSYSIHHSGSASMDRRSVNFDSKASYNGKSIWQTEGSLSRSSPSQVSIEAGKRSISLKLSPYGHAKSVDLQYRSPVYTHETHGQVDTKTYEMSLKSKSSKASEQLVDLQFDRRESGHARLTLDSVWADARAECDLSKAPMSAHVTLKSKKMRPALDMKMQATADNEHIELNGEYKQSSSAYKGSLRAQRSADSMFVEVVSVKNDKALYSGRVNAALRADGIKADARVTRKETDLAKVTVSFAKNLVDGPHQVDISLPGKQEETLRIRHEVLAGTWKASAVHMAKAEKKAFVEVEGKTHGKLSNGDVSFTLTGEKKGKKIMHMSSLQISFNHRHSFTAKSADVNSVIKAFINRKDNLVARAEGSVDLRSKANLLLELKTPLNEYSEQQVKIESSWAKKAARFEGKFVNSAGKTVTLKSDSAVNAGRWAMKTSLNSQMQQIPSIELDGSADSRGFSFTANKNGRRSLELSGHVKSAQWNNVDADIQGKYEEGPIYFASVSGKTENNAGKYNFITRKNKRDLLGAQATAEINSHNNWSTGIQLKSKGEPMASFDLMKGACENGHPQYTAAYSVKDMEKRQSSIHEADVEPLFRTIRSIRGL